MAVPKVVSSNCPTCGASLPVTPGVPQVVCRYCQNVIQVEHRKPPPNVHPFGSPGAIPSRTLYVDPAAVSAAGRGVAIAVGASVAIPIVIGLVIAIAAAGAKTAKSALKSFPLACGLNEEIEVSGNYETTGPLVTSVAHNCKLHIKNAKLKGASLVNTESFNMELSLDNVTLETTETAVHTGANLKAKLNGSTVTTASGPVFDSDSNMEITATGSTIESKAASGIKAQYNLKLRLENGKVRGKKAAVDADANMVLSMKKASELTSSEGVGVKTSSSFKLEADGGKIDAPGGAIVMTSSGDLRATNLVLSSKEKTISASSSFKAQYEGGSITSTGDIALDGDGSLNLDLAGVTVQGTTGINCDSSSKIKLTKKARVVGTTANGITAASNTELTIADASVEGAVKAFKGGSNGKFKLAQGARLAGKKGAVATEGNVDVDATGATIDGAAGAGFLTGYNAKFSFRQGSIKGVPALQFASRPSSLDLEGTRVDGEQKNAK